MKMIRVGPYKSSAKSWFVIEPMAILSGPQFEDVQIQAKVSLSLVSGGSVTAFSSCEDYSIGRLSTFRKSLEEIILSRRGSTRLAGQFGDVELMIDVSPDCVLVTSVLCWPMSSTWSHWGLEDRATGHGFFRANAEFYCDFAVLETAVTDLIEIETTLRQRYDPLGFLRKVE